VDSKHLRHSPTCHFKIVFGFALQKIAYSPRHVRRVAGNAKQVLACSLFEPYRSTHVTSVLDPMLDAAYGQYLTVCEGHPLRQSAQPGRNPSPVTESKRVGLTQRSARRDRKHNLATCSVNAQGVAACLAVTA
jgi:hypothetical protein